MNYKYVGYTKDKSIVQGTVVADNPQAAARLIASRDCQVLSLKPQTDFMPKLGEINITTPKVKPEVLILFSRQLALLLESGINIVSALELLQEQTTNNHFKKVIADMIKELRSGSMLSAVLEKHDKVFPAIYSRSLAMAEQTGSLEAVLRQLADHMEKEHLIRKKIKSAMIYPVIVTLMAIGVIVLLIAFVIPSFTSIYQAMGSDLPFITRMLLNFTTFLNSNGLYILAVLAAVIALCVVYFRTKQGRYQRDKMLLRLPLLGRVIHLNELARCCRSISLLFRAGVPLPEVMSMCVRNSGNTAMKEALTQVEKAMIRGEGISQPMSKSRLFMPMMVQMVQIGEETGSLDNTTLSVAETYETESQDRVGTLIELIQPVMTAGVGIVVGIVALSMVSAMYSMYGSL